MPGEVEYVIKTGWDDRSANWSPLLATAKGPSRGIEEDKMDLILGRNRTTICQDLDDICRQDIIPFEIDLIKNSPGIKRPKLGVASYKVGQCEVQLSNAGAYNDHMRDIHGVSTKIRDSGYTSNMHPSLNTPSLPSQNPNGGGVDSILSIVVPTLKSIDAKGGKYRAVTKMCANPGRKEVEEGIENLEPGPPPWMPMGI